MGHLTHEHHWDHKAHPGWQFIRDAQLAAVIGYWVRPAPPAQGWRPKTHQFAILPPLPVRGQIRLLRRLMRWVVQPSEQLGRPTTS